MKIIKGLKLFCWAGLILGLSGCYFTSVNPLPMKPEMDRALLGCWKTLPKKGEPHSEPGHLFFLEDKNGFFQAVIMEKGFGFDELYRGFCSEINGEKFLNLKQIQIPAGMQPPVLQPDYYLVHYRISGKKLDMTLLKEAAFKEAVAKKTLKGTISKKGGDVTITDTTDRLTAFMAGHKLADLLDEPLVSSERTDRLPGVDKK